MDKTIPVAMFSPEDRLKELYDIATKLDNDIVITDNKGLAVTTPMYEFIDDVQRMVNLILSD